MKVNKSKKITAIVIKKTAEKFASYSCGSASIWGLKQAKEPENLSMIIRYKK